MLLHRRALEVARICDQPKKDVSAAFTHVFVDEDGRCTATNGALALRVSGAVETPPDLFTEADGIDECFDCAIPGEMASAFLRAWSGDHVVVHQPKPNTIALDTTDGTTDAHFQADDVVADAPGFGHVLEPKRGAEPLVTVTLSVKQVQALVGVLKAVEASEVTLRLYGERDPIRLSAAVEGEPVVSGALMPLYV